MPFSVLERRIPSINPPNTGMQLTAPRRDRGLFDDWNPPEMLYYWGARGN